MVFHIILGPALLYFVIHQMFPPKNSTADLKQFMIERRLKIFIPFILFFWHSVIDIILTPTFAIPIWQIVIVGFVLVPLIYFKNIYFEVMVSVLFPYAFYVMFLSFN